MDAIKKEVLCKTGLSNVRQADKRHQSIGLTRLQEYPSNPQNL
jgi:hypothetical protein